MKNIRCPTVSYYDFYVSQKNLHGADTSTCWVQVDNRYGIHLISLIMPVVRLHKRPETPEQAE
jgi:hypothetical protein